MGHPLSRCSCIDCCSRQLCIEPPALQRKAATDKLVEKIVKRDSWPIQPETQTMSHIVESCTLTKLNGGLSWLHSADEDAVSWLTVMVNDTHTRRRKLALATDEQTNKQTDKHCHRRHTYAAAAIN